MIKLSVNINKIATLRNARGGNIPDLLQVAQDCERWGADGITVHPRPDERHIRYSDVYQLKPLIGTELNIEGFPSPKFIDLVIQVKPAQVTLVPDAPDAITSNAGWNVGDNLVFLRELADLFKSKQIRTSLFVGTEPANIEMAAKTGVDRVELYTEPYDSLFMVNKEKAVAPFVAAATLAKQLGLGVNAGHDLNLINLTYFAAKIPWLKEVSIGHALICDALYHGLQNTIGFYKKCL
jgi:pyridoxine 5-phosphate synthase